MKEVLYGKTLSELTALSAQLGFPDYTGKQLAGWLYDKEVDTFEAMTNISQKNRIVLETHFALGRRSPLRVQTSVDGTQKYLFPTNQGGTVETATIPDGDRLTVCVSSQVGCKMGCLFCMTGKQGFNGQLSAGEIVNQIRSVNDAFKVTNVVYMGMGEPFDNLDEVMAHADDDVTPGFDGPLYGVG